jgi:hypothetical protein
MKELFQCTDTIARIRVSPLVARTKKPCRFSHGRTLGKTTINPSTFPAPLASSRAASACRRRALASSPSLRAIRCRPPMPDIRKITVRALPDGREQSFNGRFAWALVPLPNGAEARPETPNAEKA